MEENSINVEELKNILNKYFNKLGPDYEIKIDKIIEKIDNNELNELNDINAINKILKYELENEKDLEKIKAYINEIYTFNYPKRINNFVSHGRYHRFKLEEIEKLEKERTILEKELEKLEELEELEELERKERTDKFEKQIEEAKKKEDKKREEDKKKIELVEINKKSRKKILVDASISEIESNLKDNEFLKQQYAIINENKTHIETLQKTIEEINDTNKKDAYSYEIEQLEKLNDEAIDSSIKYIIETNKIQMAIKNLEEPANVLKEEKKHAEDRREYFNKYSEYLFIISGVFFVFFILFFYLNYIIEFNFLKEKKIELTIYFLATFPIIFTGLLGLVMVRQSNLKSKELTEINKRFILIHEIKQSLRALVEIYRGKDNMNDKTEKIIDKLILNILNYASNSSKENENNEILELNTKFDNFTDSLDKKLTFISNLTKSNGTSS